MRTRIIGFISALVLASLGAAVPVAQAVVPTATGPACVAGKGRVVYDSGTGLWTCIGGKYDGEPITN
ncbi:hypothetical protein [Streptomyces sp. A1136]|uniref:hypothetical protein n=1 Tax=Streptomyces sp. A1136 TaxID=2563102 RepID=UPI00109ED626|nr:hypothetical protein [Streptomyces sp. A1136]THA44958.1 hypothetical protein E6R62_36135 [Streptomyces sp. A1136]